MPKPPTVADLTWNHDLVFSATSASQSLTVDGNSHAGPSPVQLLAISLASCMAMDVAHVLLKGRHAFRSIHAHLSAERAPEDPHRFVSVSLRFVIEGAVAGAVVERAISLSHDKYCSVWHSMRQD